MIATGADVTAATNDRTVQHHRYMRRIEEANRLGMYYCDDKHLCRVHSDAFHAAYALHCANTRPWPGSSDALIREVQAEVAAPKAPPLPWPFEVQG